MWLKLIGSIILLMGCLLIFDGRRVAKKYLNFGEENLATVSIKLFGFVLTVVGGFTMF